MEGVRVEEAVLTSLVSEPWKEGVRVEEAGLTSLVSEPWKE